MPTPPAIPAARFKAARLLLQKKHRADTGTCLIEGRRFVCEALERPGTIECLLVTGAFALTPEGGGLLRDAALGRVPVYSLSERQLGGLSETVSAQGVVAVIRLPRVDPGALLGSGGDRTLLVALDGVSDPGNLGTIIRSCAWFGVDGVLLSERSVELANPKLLRSTMGALFHVPVAAGVELAGMIPTLRRQGFRILAAEAGGEPAGSVLRGGGKMMLVFGSEAHGISPGVRALCDATFGIAGSGRIESLNVAVAVGIALHTAVSARTPGR